MTGPKLHHYVPQFHLRRFSNSNGNVWVWDRQRDRTFQASTANVAAETHFYRLVEFERLGHDPLTMEKQLADLEEQFARVTEQWLEWLPATDPGQPIPIPPANRELVSQFIAIQYLRTADVRDILAALVERENRSGALSSDERRQLHLDLMWDEDLVATLAARVSSCTWLFTVNPSRTPYLTSDNPIAFRTADSRQWVRLGFTAPGVYAVYPLSPTVVMYAHPKAPPFDAVARFDGCRSPVLVDSGMVESENSGQVFMATRFLISNRDDFDFARAFAPSIGTSRYADPTPGV